MGKKMNNIKEKFEKLGKITKKVEKMIDNIKET